MSEYVVAFPLIGVVGWGAVIFYIHRFTKKNGNLDKLEEKDE